MSLTIQIVRYFGLVVLFAGLITLGVVVPSLEPAALQAIVGAFSLVVMFIGYIWYKKVTEVAMKKGLLKKEKDRNKEYAILLLIVASSVMFSLAPTSLVHLQFYGSNSGCSADCLTYKQRVQVIEYFTLSLTLISGLLAFGPIMLGRTVLQPIMQELQYMAGAMFLILLFFLLFLFPLDVMFVSCYDMSGNQGCYIDMCQLVRSGPPLTRFLVSMILPPNYTC